MEFVFQWEGYEEWKKLLCQILDPVEMALVVDLPVIKLLRDHANLISQLTKDTKVWEQKADLVGRLMCTWFVQNQLASDHGKFTMQMFDEFAEKSSKGEELLSALSFLGMDSADTLDWSNPFTPHMLALQNAMHADEGVKRFYQVKVLFGWYWQLNAGIMLILMFPSYYRTMFCQRSLQDDDVRAVLSDRFAELKSSACWHPKSESFADKICERLQMMISNLKMGLQYRGSVWEFVFVASQLLAMSDDEIRQYEIWNLS